MRSPPARRSGSRSRTRSRTNLTFSLLGDFTIGTLYLVVILIAVYVCTLAIQGATVRLMFSMGRDRRLPLGRPGATCTGFKTPANAAVAVGVLAAIPLVVTGAGSADLPRHRGDRDDLRRLLPVQPRRPRRARRKGWPHEAAWFSLKQWGTVINVLALVWGGLMIVNIGSGRGRGLR